MDPNAKDCLQVKAGSFARFAVRFVQVCNSLLRGANLVCTHSRASSTQSIQQTVQFSPPSRLQLLMRGGVTTIT